jgi:hypothetical protein
MRFANSSRRCEGDMSISAQLPHSCENGQRDRLKRGPMGANLQETASNVWVVVGAAKLSRALR